jgi:serine protease
MRGKAFRFIWLSFVFAAGLLGAFCSNGGDGDIESEPLYYTVSGTIKAPDNNVADSDVNNPSAPYEPNDSFAQAQAVPNPAIIGGYVNVAGTGISGRSELSGDKYDYYRATLAVNQAINLYMGADPNVADLDMHLFDDTQTLVDSSAGISEFETLTIPASGIYYIVVEAYADASTYNLTIGQSTTTSIAKRSPRLSDDFVHGEAIVRFKDDLARVGDGGSSVLAVPPVGMTIKAGTHGRAMLLGFNDEATKIQAFQALGISEADQAVGSHAADFNTKRKLDTLYLIKALHNHPDVLYAEPNYARQALTDPNDTHYPLQWHFPLINLPQAWDITLPSPGDNVIVAVVDSGALFDHPDLEGQFIEGYDFVSDPENAIDNDGIDDNPEDPGDGGVGGSSFHGTHTAGTVAAATNNMIGVAGVAWNAKIMPLRAIGQFGATSYDMQQAVRYAAGLDNDSGTRPPRSADIINLSLGGSGFLQSSQEVFMATRNAGVIVIAAAGNESTDVPTYPASYQGVVSVSAVDMHKEFASYSNFGSAIDVAAPGGDTSQDSNQDGYLDGVLSASGDDSSGQIQFVYKFYQGTSMACPHMAGVVALMKAIHPALSPDDLDTLLANGVITEDLGEAGWDERYGNGLIDALRAIGEAQRLAGGGELPATLVVNPPSLDFGIATTTASFTVANGGGSGTTLTVNSVNPSEGWVTVVPSGQVDVGGLGTYTVTVDRSSLGDDGVYSAKITVDSDANDVVIPLSVLVSSVTGSGNTGLHYVLLVDPDTLETQSQESVTYNEDIDGYAYSFTGVSAGTYQIFAGTDANNDGIIGDAGEAFGAYITADQPTSVTISSDTSGLDFTTGFDMNLPSRSGIARLTDRAIHRVSVPEKLN